MVEKDEVSRQLFRILDDNLEKCFKADSLKIKISSEIDSDPNEEPYIARVTKAEKNWFSVATFYEDRVRIHKECFVYCYDVYASIRYDEIRKIGFPSNLLCIETTDNRAFLFKDDVINKEPLKNLLEEICRLLEVPINENFRENKQFSYTTPNKNNVKGVKKNSNHRNSYSYSSTTAKKKKRAKCFTDKIKKNGGAGVAAAREILDGKVGIDAVKRVGRNPQLKGTIHEIMVRDKYNAKHLFDGTKAVLSESTTAVRDDILIKKGTKIIGRMQLKDTPSAISKTIKQVKAKHYAGTNLMGTKETVSAYEAAVKSAARKGTKITQKMKSTGISSSDTSLVAKKTIGSAAGKISVGTLGKVAASSGAIGAAVSGGIELCTSGRKYIKGEISGKDFTGRVAQEAVGGGLSAACGSGVATLVASGVASSAAAATAPVWIPAAAGVATAAAAGFVVQKVWKFGCKHMKKFA